MAFSEDPKMITLAGMMEMSPDDETAIKMCNNVLTLPILAKLTEYSELQAEDVRYVADYLYKSFESNFLTLMTKAVGSINAFLPKSLSAAIAFSLSVSSISSSTTKPFLAKELIYVLNIRLESIISFSLISAQYHASLK